MSRRIHIGIITIVRVDNYGAELQAFALQRKLELMGYDAEIIDYLFYKHPLYKREKASAPFYPFPLRLKIKEYVLPLIEKIRKLPYTVKSKNRIKGFNAFHEKHTRFSPVRYKAYSELYTQVPTYDVYCTGSDQVWNPNCFTSLYPYFLTFAPESSKKISYASSFGVSELPASAVMAYRSGIENLDRIAVREKRGAKIVKDLTGKDATVVVDPTLLLKTEEWKSVADYKKVPENGYILLYVLKDSDYITKTAMKMAQKNGLQIVRICKGAFRQDTLKSGILDIMDASPDDFIGLFDKATFILTNSFHGTVFSIIFRKEFYTILKRTGRNNSRQLDLLDSLGMGERISYEGEFCEKNKIDYTACLAKLDLLIEKSEKYLKTAIEN